MKSTGDLSQKWRTLSPLRPTTKFVVILVVLICLILLFAHFTSNNKATVDPADEGSYSGLIQPELTQKLSEYSRPVLVNRPVTVVSAYYKIPSKHKSTEYDQWMPNFLAGIPCHLYVFTDEQSAPQIRKHREKFMDRTKIIVLPFADLIEAKRMAMYKEQHAVDSEKSYHTPEVYIVWNEKIHFLMKAIQDNVFDSDYFMWTDIGCFRDPWRATQLTTYPDTNTTSLLLGRDRVYFLQMGNFAKTDHTLAANGVPIKDFRYEVRLGGTMFGGHASALIKYDKLFYSTMELMLKDGRFIGKDQNIMSSIAMMHPELVKRVRPESYLNGGDPWFYTQYYFSKRPLTTEDIQKESQD